MGANFESVELDGSLTNEQVRKKYGELVREQEYEYGHGGYSGTFATLAGIEVQSRVFDNRKMAEDYLVETHHKRDPAIAVKFKDNRREVIKRPTFGGNPVSNDWRGPKPIEVIYYYSERPSQDAPYSCHTKSVALVGNEVLFADQLKPEDLEKLKKCWMGYDLAGKEWKNLDGIMQGLLKKMGNMEEDFTTEEWSELKKTRRSLKKALMEREKTKKKFLELDTKLGERLYEYETKDHGTKWLVGGWCAS